MGYFEFHSAGHGFNSRSRTSVIVQRLEQHVPNANHYPGFEI